MDHRKLLQLETVSQEQKSLETGPIVKDLPLSFYTKLIQNKSIFIKKTEKS